MLNQTLPADSALNNNKRKMPKLFTVHMISLYCCLVVRRSIVSSLKTCHFFIHHKMTISRGCFDVVQVCVLRIRLGLGRGCWGGRSDVRNVGSSIRIGVVTIGISCVIRRDYILDSGSVGSWVSGVGGGITGVGEVRVTLNCGVARGPIGVPFGVNTVNAVVLLSSFLVLSLHGNNASSQSQETQQLSPLLLSSCTNP
uniref:Uncharacterized protein n=1 Tax=Daphnia magna TaxID=35525 RepID=A0A0P6E5U7_9CRUS